MSYPVSVVLVSLALYGLWYVGKDLWNWFTALQGMCLPAVSFVIFVHNLEYEVEDLLRYLVHEISDGSHEHDVIVVDCGSDDLTPAILRRLSAELPVLTVVRSECASRPLPEVLPICRGAVVHVLDLAGRLDSRQFKAVVTALLGKNQQGVVVRNV